MQTVTQIGTYAKTTYTSFEISRVCTKEYAEKFVQAIEGQTYMNFHVNIAPAYGEFAVSVETTFDAPEEEIQDMLMGLMFSAISNP